MTQASFRFGRNALFLAGLEDPAAEGVEVALTVADNYIPVEGLFPPKDDYAVKNNRQDTLRGDYSIHTAPEADAGHTANWATKHIVQGSRNGLAYTLDAGVTLTNLPYDHALMIGAGYTPVWDTVTSTLRYTLNTSLRDQASLTEYYYVDGVLYKSVGVRTTFKETFAPGGMIMRDWTHDGLAIDVATVDTPTPVFDKSVNPNPGAILAKGVGCSIAGYSNLILRSFEFDTGNTFNKEPDANAPDAIRPSRLGVRAPKWKAVIVAPKTSEKDFNLLRRTKAPVPMAWMTPGATNHLKGFSAAAVRIEDLQTAFEANSTITYTLSGGCYDSEDGAGDAVTHIYG